MPANKTPALFRLLTILTIALTVVGYPATAIAEAETEMTDIEKAFDHRGYKSYKHARFTVHPNKDVGTNDALAGLLTDAAFGGSGSTFYTIEIWYNRYRDKIVLSELTTGFPPMVDIDPKW